MSIIISTIMLGIEHKYYDLPIYIYNFPSVEQINNDSTEYYYIIRFINYIIIIIIITTI